MPRPGVWILRSHLVILSVGFSVLTRSIVTGSFDTGQLLILRAESRCLHVNFRYGTFYNCPVERKGISVTGGACHLLA